MNIVGLGQAGCNIAECFSQHPQYNVYKLDNGLPRAKNTYPIAKRDTHEEYDKNPLKLTQFVSRMKDSQEVLFVMAGSGAISGASLQVLEHLHKKFDVHVLYVKPDAELLNGVGQLQERVCYRILQEYARSGVLKSMCIVSNPHMEDVLGEVPAIGYYEELNSLLVSVLHMINIFKHTEPVIETRSALGDHVRLYTVGIVDISSGEQKMFFPVNNSSDRCYYYGIGNQDLKTDGKLFKKIKSQVKSFSNEGEYGVSYSIHSTEYKENFAYCSEHSSKIQFFPEKALTYD